MSIVYDRTHTIPFRLIRTILSIHLDRHVKPSQYTPDQRAFESAYMFNETKDKSAKVLYTLNQLQASEIAGEYSSYFSSKAWIFATPPLNPMTVEIIAIDNRNTRLIVSYPDSQNGITITQAGAKPQPTTDLNDHATCIAWHNRCYDHILINFVYPQIREFESAFITPDAPNERTAYIPFDELTAFLQASDKYTITLMPPALLKAETFYVVANVFKRGNYCKLALSDNRRPVTMSGEYAQEFRQLHELTYNVHVAEFYNTITNEWPQAFDAPDLRPTLAQPQPPPTTPADDVAIAIKEQKKRRGGPIPTPEDNIQRIIDEWQKVKGTIPQELFCAQKAIGVSTLTKWMRDRGISGQ